MLRLKLIRVTKKLFEIQIMQDFVFHICGWNGIASTDLRQSLILLRKTSRLHAGLLEQLERRVCARMLHHCQQPSSGGFGVGLGMVLVVKLMADVRRKSKMILGGLSADTAI